jgi:hypothetical protein
MKPTTLSATRLHHTATATKSLRVRTGVRAGSISLNHNVTMR